MRIYIIEMTLHTSVRSRGHTQANRTRLNSSGEMTDHGNENEENPIN